MNPRAITMQMQFNNELPPRDYVLSVTFVVQAGAIRLGEAVIHDGKDWVSVPLWMFEVLRESTAVVDMIGREGDAIRAEWAEVV